MAKFKVGDLVTGIKKLCKLKDGTWHCEKITGYVHPDTESLKDTDFHDHVVISATRIFAYNEGYEDMGRDMGVRKDHPSSIFMVPESDCELVAKATKPISMTTLERDMTHDPHADNKPIS